MPINPKIVRGIIFDVDGTLHDTDDQFVLRLSGWIKPIRFISPRIDPVRLARWTMMHLETPANFIYKLADRSGLDGMIAGINDWLFRLGLIKTPRPYKLIDGVAEMLEVLSPHYLLGIVSARGKRPTDLFLRTFGIEKYFTAVATAQTCQRTKPYPDPILWVTRQMGISPANCIMVGDTTVDILSGKAAGCQTAGVLCGFGTQDELIKHGADIILPSTTNLQKVLREN